MPKPSTALTVVPPQRGMFDHEITDPTLHGLIEEMFKLEQRVRDYTAARKTVRESFKLMPDIKDADRILVRHSDEDEAKVPYVIRAKERRGGGHTVNAWTRIGIGTIELFRD